ncbi:hypothetical protein CSC73_09950 [Pseudoxanthomonas sacheonensis]|nr:hypothetical protein CSC73_09950 [Pseudoxanthomonas sacheonensis]
MVDHGSASGQQLLSPARRIAESVHARFGVTIEPEPKIIGAIWQHRLSSPFEKGGSRGICSWRSPRSRAKAKAKANPP